MEGPYLLEITDVYFKWIELLFSNSITADAVTLQMTQVCATLGLPSTIVSDNGTQFTSSQYQGFYNKHGIHSVFVTPYHPRSKAWRRRRYKLCRNGRKRIKITVTNKFLNLSYTLNYLKLTITITIDTYRSELDSTVTSPRRSSPN